MAETNNTKLNNIIPYDLFLHNIIWVEWHYPAIYLKNNVYCNILYPQWKFLYTSLDDVGSDKKCDQKKMLNNNNYKVTAGQYTHQYITENVYIIIHTVM